MEEIFKADTRGKYELFGTFTVVKSFSFKPFLRVCAQVGIELESDLNTIMMTFKDL